MPETPVFKRGITSIAKAVLVGRTRSPARFWRADPLVRAGRPRPAAGAAVSAPCHASGPPGRPALLPLLRRKGKYRHGRAASQTAFGVHRAHGLFQAVAPHPHRDGPPA